jgi:hypothetical protein
MRFSVLVLDYDGTIARNGVLDAQVRTAIGEARGRGIVVVLATGRILAELRRVAGDLRFVDAVVAENGAVAAFPESGHSMRLAGPAPPELAAKILAMGIPAEIGESVIEAGAEHAQEILTLIQELELPQVIVFNRGRLMVLPSGVNKATGLREALRALRLSPHNAIAIGDAENDHDLLEVCELGVAVAWGSPALKDRADMVLAGEGPPAVAKYIQEVAHQPRLAPELTGRRHLLLGSGPNGEPVSLAVQGRNVLVVGDPKSGKSWVAGLLCEHLILKRYSVCVIDPEGDYTGLEALPRVIVLGGTKEGPSPRELRVALRYPDVNMILDLSMMSHQRKKAYIHSLLPALAGIRRRYGVPHRIVLDEAHYFLGEGDGVNMLDLEMSGYTLVTYHPSRLHPEVRAASEAVIVTRLTDPREQEHLARWRREEMDFREAAGGLELGEALVLPKADTCADIPCAPCVIQLAQRLTPHIRHRKKYLDVPVAEDRAFVFILSGRPPMRAQTLREFTAVVATLTDAELKAHLDRHDFSRWIAGVFGDDVLAAELHNLEQQYRDAKLPDLNGAIISAIENRYEVPSPALAAQPRVR